jgi:hypothetical protein
MNIEEAKEDFKSSIAMTLHGGKHTIVSIKAIETVLSELEKKEAVINEMVRIDPHIYRMANIRLEEREGK